jgi:arylsulfatase A
MKQIPTIALLLLSVVAVPIVAAAEPPNIIFIMADDLGIGDLGCYGQRHIQTPNIDRLAAEGMRFTDAYAGSAVCAPARCVLMTGLHTGHARVRNNAAARGGYGPQRRVPLLPEDVTVAEVLKQAGYTCGVVGKWGLGEPGTTGVPNRQGFDFWFGYLNQSHAHGYYPEFLWRNEECYPLEGNYAWRTGAYAHDLFTREALEFIEQNHERPFFLYLPYTIPHGKLQVPSLEPYADRDWPESHRAYAAMVTRMDRDIGRLMQRLKRLEIDRRTLVFFTSDNGATTAYLSGDRFFESWGPYRGEKGSLYEGGIRVPLIARWPEHIAAGSTSNVPCYFADFLPTAAELAGVKPPAGLDGISLAPVLAGSEPPQRDFLFWEIRKGSATWRAVRHGNFKAVCRQFGEAWELYDLAADPGERNNLAAEQPEVVARIEAWAAGARTESPYWPTSQ